MNLTLLIISNANTSVGVCARQLPFLAVTS